MLNLLVKFFPEKTRNFETFVKLSIAVICELLTVFSLLLSFSKPLPLPSPRSAVEKLWHACKLNISIFFLLYKQNIKNIKISKKPKMCLLKKIIKAIN